MNIIHKLSEDLIPKIAAGEVVESPNSVVKELLDNSIDAGSSIITVELNGAGFDLIRVIDDGCGISSEDLDICFQPFYTSKLVSIDDLNVIKTLGFRGEALSSICAVASTTIKSRQSPQISGYSLEIREGVLLNKTKFGMNPGTIVEVQGLFKNIPARRKFFKDAKLEYQKILSTFVSYALCYFNISFKLYRDGKLILNLPQAKYIDRVKAVLGEETIASFIEFTATDARFSLTGYVAKPQAASVFPDNQYLFVNKRLVLDKNISRAVKKAYDTLLPHDAYPPYVIFLSISPDLIDVNVHPKKTAVAFWDEGYVLNTIEAVVRDRLKSADLTYIVGQHDDFRYDKTAAASTFLKLKDAGPIWRTDSAPFELYAETVQIANTYIATPVKQGLLLVDQHAAHESILYEDFYAKYSDQRLKSSQLTLPGAVVVNFGLKEVQLLLDNLVPLEEYGFEISQTGPKDFTITKIPEFLLGRDISELLKNLLSEIFDAGKIPDLDNRTKKTLAFLACRSAVKAGDVLSHTERRNIFLKLDDCSDIYSCPHGRPVKMIVTVPELARLFKRIK